MSGGYIAQQIVNGLILGSMYALVAIGFSMIYGIIRLINFAHGEIIMIGAFLTLGLLQKLQLPFPVAAPLVLIAGAVVGIIIEKGAFRPMRGAPQVTGFIASLGVSIMLQNLGILLLTAQPRNFTFPDYLQSVVQIGLVSFRTIDGVIMASALVLMGGLLFLVHKTRLGMAMRATAENIDVARLMGININRTIMATFAIGSALAAIAGLMWGGKFGQIDPLLGFVPGLKSFVAAVIGGVGSIPGAILGGYILGLSEVLFVGLLPPIYSAFRDAFVFSTLILILLVLPNGILGKKMEDRA
ncbi:MAG: branched-chain amino acid ABC transporter permease [Deltaproteobacteria bacterium]|nr:branched-chain amino acid ABC transporter permease [Deltaproteobacteria bacterium]MBW1956185.1 branched-chain amino acid ABC transporter permease [Deltaproteobacteria bacterium]MBW2042958.1 branched-chain amino acid ABC transporter permease [Deltaproteobacteria bacterium]MBW2132543.1 branched-chain amino acid ABC transporter permease [Deltaproteobacteria bacterium]